MGYWEGEMYEMMEKEGRLVGYGCAHIRLRRMARVFIGEGGVMEDGLHCRLCRGINGFITDYSTGTTRP